MNIAFPSIPSVMVGSFFLGLALLESAWGHPPYTLFFAFFFASFVALWSAIGGFSWGFLAILLQGCVAFMLRHDVEAAVYLSILSFVWYAGVTLLAAQGSRVLMGISSALLFVGLLLPRMGLFSWETWILVGILALCEGGSMYFLGNMFRGKWFAPYA